MKAVFISYNQALTDRVSAILDRRSVRGYTLFDQTQGRGMYDGEPHMGTHTWPSMNASILAIMEDEKVAPLLESLRALDSETKMQGLRAFVWNIEDQM